MLEMLLMLLAMSFVLATAIMALFPKSDSSISLHRMFVEPLSRFLMGPKPLKTLAFVMFVVIVCVSGPETLMIMSIAGVDAAAIEIMLIVWAASLSVGFSNTWKLVKQQTAALVRRIGHAASLRRAPRSRRIRKGRKPGRNDDSTGPAGDWAFA
jgi:hypothetical protein